MMNVRAVERDQLLLMPPSLTDWLPSDHLAFLILDVVSELDLSELYRSLRADGRGGASYHPEMMLAVLLYAYCVGERSSRRIERRLVEDVAFRVIAANQAPDHATVARFRRRHQEAIAGLFAQLLGLCVAEGLVDAGVVAIDSTKLEADVSRSSNRTRRQLVDEILKEAEAVDAAEDEQFGEARGDELPDRWVDRRDRRARLREALRQLDADGPSDPETYQVAREKQEAERGRKFGGRKANLDARWGSRARTRQVNVTDPDSRTIKDGARFIQGYAAHAAVSADQMVVAAEVSNVARDSTLFQPMVAASEANLTAAGCDPTEVFVADAGYWSAINTTVNTAADVLIAPMPATQDITDPDDPRIVQRKEVIERLERGELTVRAAADEMQMSTTSARKLLRSHRSNEPDPVQARAQMLQRLADNAGAAAYAKRKTTVEPVFGNLKANHRFRRFSLRGLDQVRSEWRLICAAHNLLKLHRHRLAVA